MAENVTFRINGSEHQAKKGTKGIGLSSRTRYSASAYLLFRGPRYPFRAVIHVCVRLMVTLCGHVRQK